MKCSAFRNCISDFIDGNLSGHLHSAVESHIQDCHSCKQYADSLKKMVAGLRSLRVEQANLNIWSSIQDRLTASPQRHWQDYVLRPLALVPACAVALLLVIALLLPITHTFDKPAPGLTATEFHQYMGAHAKLRTPQMMSDPDVRFVSTELQYVSPGGSFGK